MKTILGIAFVLLFSGHGAGGGLVQSDEGVRPEKSYLSTDKGHGGTGGLAVNGGSSSGGYVSSTSGFEKG